MKTLTFDTLLKKQLYLSQVTPLYQQWKSKKYSGYVRHGRPDHGIMYFCGTGRFGGISVEDGDILYLPKGCRYAVEFDACADGSLPFDYLINFLLYDENFEPIRLSRTPLLIRVKDAHRFFHRFSDMVQNAIDRHTSPSALSADCLRLLCDVADAETRTERDGAIFDAVDYIKAHAFDPDLRIGDVAARVHMSAANFRRVFEAWLSCSPKEYVSRLRLSHAKSLLQCGVSVCDTAQSCGFADPAYFIRFYKKQTGTTPGRSAKGAPI